MVTYFSKSFLRTISLARAPFTTKYKSRIEIGSDIMDHACRPCFQSNCLWIASVEGTCQLLKPETRS